MKGSAFMAWENKGDKLIELNSNKANKPIIIYQFIDPFCDHRWQIELIIKVLALEYGNFFIVRPSISLNSSFRNTTIKENICMVKHNLGLAIKAAELQGNKTGRQFLSKIQEGYFISNNDLFNEEILMKYAELTDLELEKFENDISSSSATKAIQTDLKLIQEMHIKEFPSLVFSSKHNERHNLKVTGLTDYNAYVQLIYKLPNNIPKRQKKPPIHLFLKEKGLHSLENITFIYD